MEVVYLVVSARVYPEGMNVAFGQFFRQVLLYNDGFAGVFIRSQVDEAETTAPDELLDEVAIYNGAGWKAVSGLIHESVRQRVGCPDGQPFSGYPARGAERCLSKEVLWSGCIPKSNLIKYR